MIVSFLTEQGGVGKTSLVFNLGWYLATQGKKVLLVDLDPQGGNLSRLLGVSDLDERPGVVDIIREPDKYNFTNTVIKVNDYLSFVPANEYAREIPDVYKSKGEDEKCLKTMLDKVKRKYDFIFIDTSPAPSDAHILSLVASDSLIIPLLPDVKSIDATQNVIDTYEAVKQAYNKKLEILGLVYNFYDNRPNISRVVQEALAVSYNKKKIRFTETKIPRNVSLTNAWAVKTGVTESYPRSKGAQSYIELSKELFGI
ncbi:MAG: ParA family protein [Lachnospiraceae bacterium]|nr:ParA family protein [Lachnospiraceae bacterium]